MFNITAKAYDLRSSSPKQLILINDLIESANSKSAIDKFKLNMLIDDIVVEEVFSVEEIFQDSV